MEQALVVPDTQNLAVISPMAIEEIVGQVNLIQSVMSKVMKNDEHYGIIPGTGNKPSLLKSGAEKLSMTFRMAPEYEIQAIDMGNSHREYEVICRLSTIQTGVFLGSGVGNCNTKESKYRYRSENTGKAVPGKYWENRDTDLLGGKQFKAKKKDGKWVICEQIEHDNPADYYNTVKKMAKKRAFVDAVLTVTAASDIFTQDIEDLTHFDKEDTQKPKDTPPPADQANHVDQTNRLVKLIDSDNTVDELSKRHKDNLSLIKAFPDDLKRKVMDAINAQFKVITAKEATTPPPVTPDPAGETSASPADTEEPPSEEGDNLPPEFGEGPEFMTDDEKHKVAASELMTSLTNTKPSEVEEVIVGLKKGYLNKFPQKYQDEILAHCDRLLEGLKKEEKKGPGDNPAMVKNLLRYIDQCQDKAGALEQIRKDSFPKLNKSDQEIIIKYINK